MDVHFSREAVPNRPSSEAVKTALTHLLGSCDLKLSERNRRFLAFVVSETLSGRGGRIKAYSVGVDVFGRSENFDPGTDPIVRIEATRLRAALATYYDGAGADDLVRISIHPGSYIPIFEWGKPSAAQDQAPASKSVSETLAEQFSRARDIAILVKHHTDIRDRRATARSELLIESVVARLNKLGFRIFLMPPPEQQAAVNSVKSLLTHPESLYALDVAVHSLSDRRRFSWCVTDLQSGRVKCTDFLDRVDKGVPVADMIDELAEYAVNSVTEAVS
jgi:hypothetical protein